MKEKKRNNAVKKGFYCIIMVIGLTMGTMIIPVQGQEAKFPSKPLEIVVPFAAGGYIDVASRIIADPLSRELGVPVVIKNMAGAGGLTGTVEFMKIKPDGYTILAANAGSMISGVQRSKTPPYDPRKDLLPLAYFADAPAAMSVKNSAPFKSIDSFIQYAKNNPGKLIGSTTSLGGEAHLMYLGIVKDAKINSKLVPYEGGASIFTALIGGHVDWATQSLTNTMPFVKSGDVRVLLLTRASSELPGVPAGSDAGLPSVSGNMWVGFLAHPQIPNSAYTRLIKAVESATKDPEAITKLKNVGFNVDYKNPDKFSNFIQEEWNSVSQILRESGLLAK